MWWNHHIVQMYALHESNVWMFEFFRLILFYLFIYFATNIENNYMHGVISRVVCGAVCLHICMSNWGTNTYLTQHGAGLNCSQEREEVKKTRPSCFEWRFVEGSLLDFRKLSTVSRELPPYWDGVSLKMSRLRGWVTVSEDEWPQGRASN